MERETDVQVVSASMVPSTLSRTQSSVSRSDLSKASGLRCPLAHRRVRAQVPRTHNRPVCQADRALRRLLSRRDLLWLLPRAPEAQARSRRWCQRGQPQCCSRCRRRWATRQRRSEPRQTRGSCRSTRPLRPCSRRPASRRSWPEARPRARRWRLHQNLPEARARELAREAGAGIRRLAVVVLIALDG